MFWLYICGLFFDLMPHLLSIHWTCMNHCWISFHLLFSSASIRLLESNWQCKNLSIGKFLSIRWTEVKNSVPMIKHILKKKSFLDYWLWAEDDIKGINNDLRKKFGYIRRNYFSQTKQTSSLAVNLHLMMHFILVNSTSVGSSIHGFKIFNQNIALSKSN